MVVGEVREALLGNLPWSDLRGKIEYAINLSTDISRIFKYEREHTDEKNNSLYEILYIIFDYSHKHYTFKQFEV